MKRIIQTALVLTVFALTLILFQISCNDEAIANPSGSNQIKNRLLYYKVNHNTDVTELYTIKLDGTDKKSIPLMLPAGLKIRLEGLDAAITPDGKSLIFVAKDVTNKWHIYSVGIDGTGLNKIVDGTTETGEGIIYNIIETY
ncbi:MAG: hypothetical protein L6Q51_06240 [Cyclobacteriaceae bacterium]|nr:hypothetical protein [Cyclobacteriaceae bacterium]